MATTEDRTEAVAGYILQLLRERGPMTRGELCGAVRRALLENRLWRGNVYIRYASGDDVSRALQKLEGERKICEAIFGDKVMLTPAPKPPIDWKEECRRITYGLCPSTVSMVDCPVLRGTNRCDGCRMLWWEEHEEDK